ncbi:MAG: radical SAM family heme chaperone HemW [Flavobacterium sp.]
MLGIYIHIPFCKQACFYCDFHFSTSTKKKSEMIEAIQQELIMRKNEILNEPVETIYFGGGTPSLLSVSEINAIIETIFLHFEVVENPEITLEANPDDLSLLKIQMLASTKINRLSIGVQSFYEEDLRMMNRAHNAEEALQCLQWAKEYFSNISIDLIYGVPEMSDERWQSNIQKALDLNVPHISSYALTVEPKTAFDHFIKKGIMQAPDDDVAQNHFHILVDMLENEGFVHYEISNFGREGWFSKNNTAYWQGKKYLGVGPSAHSFDGQNRSWNVKNNALYIQKINDGHQPSESETLTKTDLYNEYVMTGLRTIWGVSLLKISNDFGKMYLEYFLKQAKPYLEEHLLFEDDQIIRTTKKGKFLSDGIASDLFLLNL